MRQEKIKKKLLNISNSETQNFEGLYANYAIILDDKS